MSTLFIDIETQRTDNPAVIRRLQDAVKPPGQYKKPESIAQWMAAEGAAARVEAVAKTALDGTYGRLATIGYALNDDEPVILGGPDVDENTLLLELRAMLMARRPGDVFDFVAFNGDFDFRFLRQRAIIKQIPMSLLLPHLDKRGSYFDPMHEWAGYRGYISQADLEVALGIPRDDDIDGSQVGEAIDAGDWDRVIKHNREDIIGLRKIYRRMTA